MANPYYQVESFQDGEVIAQAGEDGRELYVVQSGHVVLTHRRPGGDGREETLGPGGFFGELSLLQGVPRQETARAKGPTRLLVLEPGTLLLRLRRDPTFAFEMLERMSRRILELETAAREIDTTSSPPPAGAPSGKPSVYDTLPGFRPNAPGAHR